jgi:hypothetical protein
MGRQVWFRSEVVALETAALWTESDWRGSLRVSLLKSGRLGERPGPKDYEDLY